MATKKVVNQNIDTNPIDENEDLAMEAATAPAKREKTKLKFTKKKAITRQLLKLEFGNSVYVLIESEIFQADDTGGRSNNLKPPMLAHVIELETGEEMQMIFPAVLEAELTKHYKDESYVGKSFEICKHEIQGKKYSGFTINEIELD